MPEKLNWGNWRYWLVFGLAVVAYYALQAVLNAVFGQAIAHHPPRFCQAADALPIAAVGRLFNIANQGIALKRQING
jgi:hypothetical protein